MAEEYRKITDENGVSYEGCWKDGKKNGPFVVVTAESTIRCSYQDDVQFSEGTIDYTNGDRYKGRLEDLKPNGKGVMKFHDGIVYAGDFENGLLDGLDCTITYPNGDQYTGHFSHGVTYNDGIYTYGKDSGK